MSLEYAPSGLIGLLTPQANTTAELEFGALLPRGVAPLVARMTSQCATLEDRLIEYFDRLDETIAQFSNAPLSVIAVACTGSSYLIGPAAENALLERLSARFGVPVTSAGRSVVQACRALSVQRVAVLSPYSESLTHESVTYWQTHGIEVLEVVRIEAASSAFHPIYAMKTGMTAQALQSVQTQHAQAIIALGTGLPSLHTVLTRARQGGTPLFSCMVALAWNALNLAQIGQPGPMGLAELLRGAEWGERFESRYGDPDGQPSALDRLSPSIIDVRNK